jgi:hypothetical protein
VTTPAGDFALKAHDRLPHIEAVLGFAPNFVADLTTATQVRFIMRDQTKPNGAPKVNDVGVIVEPTLGAVRYEWKATDVDTPGVYNAEWEVTYEDGLKQTFPTLTYHTVLVLADLDGA